MPTTRSVTYGLSFLFLLAGAASAQQAPRGERTGFSLYARALVGDRGEPSLRVSAHVPHSNLVFLKKDGSFEAEYQLYIKILDAKGGRLIDSNVTTKKVVVSDYNDTRSHKLSSTVSRHFDLGAGNYVVRAMIRVKDTHRAFVKETPVTITTVIQTGIEVTKPRMYAASIDTMRTVLTLRPAEYRDDRYVEQRDEPIFAEYGKQPAFQFDVIVEDSSGAPPTCELVYQVLDEKSSQVLYGRSMVTVQDGEQQFVLSFSVDEWDEGRYLLNIKGLLPGGNRVKVAGLPFGVAFTRTAVTKHFNRTLEILSYIASAAELDPLRKATEQQRAAAWSEFWHERDPDPATPENEALEEHWRRVLYATKNFATSEPGWRSDRGKVYIRHGEPDEVEIRSDPYVQGEYLIWRYFDDNLTFVFFDRFGLGEYRLTNSETY